MAVGDIGRRVKQARESLPGLVRMRAVDLAKALQVLPQRLNGWEKGKHDPPTEMLERIASTLQVSIEWLLGEPVPMRDPSVSEQRAVYRAGVRLVPIYGAITAGSPSSTDSQVVKWYEMKDWGGEFERWGRIIDGFSMEPELQDGDWAIFENRLAEPSHVVHAYDAGQDTVKVWRRVNGKSWLWPANPDYEPIDATGWNVKGVCIGYVRWDSDGSETLKTYRSGMRWKPSSSEIEAAKNFFQK